LFGAMKKNNFGEQQGRKIILENNKEENNV
jgi:hypothetical protein